MKKIVQNTIRCMTIAVVFVALQANLSAQTPTFTINDSVQNDGTFDADELPRALYNYSGNLFTLKGENIADGNYFISFTQPSAGVDVSLRDSENNLIFNPGTYGEPDEFTPVESNALKNGFELKLQAAKNWEGDINHGILNGILTVKNESEEILYSATILYKIPKDPVITIDGQKYDWDVISAGKLTTGENGLYSSRTFTLKGTNISKGEYFLSVQYSEGDNTTPEIVDENDSPLFVPGTMEGEEDSSTPIPASVIQQGMKIKLRLPDDNYTYGRHNINLELKNSLGYTVCSISVSYFIGDTQEFTVNGIPTGETIYLGTTNYAGQGTDGNCDPGMLLTITGSTPEILQNQFKIKCTTNTITSSNHLQLITYDPLNTLESGCRADMIDDVVDGTCFENGVSCMVYFMNEYAFDKIVQDLTVTESIRITNADETVTYYDSEFTFFVPGNKLSRISPRFSVAEGKFSEPVSLEMTTSSTSQENSIYYTLDGSAPSITTQRYNGAINISKPTVVNAVTVEKSKDKWGNESLVYSDVTTAFYDIAECDTVDNIAAFLAATEQDKTVAIRGMVTVTAVHTEDNCMFVQDETGALCIKGMLAPPIDADGNNIFYRFEPGHGIVGLTGTYSKTNNRHEIIPDGIDDEYAYTFAVENGTCPNPTSLTISDIDINGINNYVALSRVAVKEDCSLSDGSIIPVHSSNDDKEEILIINSIDGTSMGVKELSANSTYEVEGILSEHEGSMCLLLTDISESKYSSEYFSITDGNGLTIYYREITPTTAAVVAPFENSEPYSGDIAIPSTITDRDGMKVVQIDGKAFENSAITSVVIPETIEQIGGAAFDGCANLKTLTFNALNCADFQSDYHAPFKDAKLTSVVFGDKVQRIPAHICYNQTALTSVSIPESVTVIGKHAFAYCTELKTVHFNAIHGADNQDSYISPFVGSTLTTFIFGDKVEYITPYLLNGQTLLTSIVIPQSVTEIGGNAFSGCTGLSSISIPESVTELSSNSFSGCTALQTLNFNMINCADFQSDYYAPFKDAKLTSVVFGDKVQRIPAYICSNQTALTSVSIPESVTEIGSNAFHSCTGLSTITIPETVTKLGERAFSGCTALQTLNFNMINCADFQSDYQAPFKDAKLTSVVFGNNVQRIPAYIFSNQTALTSVSIPESVTEIGSEAFRGCTGLSSITIPESVTEIGGYAFAYCTELKTVHFNAIHCADNQDSYESPFVGSTLTTFIFGDKVEYITTYLLKGQTLLTSIIIPQSVTEIGSVAFHGCTGLTSISIPESVTKIGSEVFAYCDGLTSIVVPETVKEIGGRTFGGCTNLRTLKILNKELVVEVHENDYGEPMYPDYFLHSLMLDTIIAPAPCFLITAEYYENITRILPLSVRYIGINGGELSDNSVTFINAQKKAINTLDLSGITNTVLPEMLCDGMYKLDSLVLPGNLQTIPYKTAAECTALKEIKIPASVTAIETSAFEDCRSIERIEFEEGSALETIGDWAFYNCHKLANIVLPSGVNTIGDAAFYGCNKLSDIVLPASLSSIGDNGFALCEQLKQMTVNATVPPVIDRETFYEVNRTIPVYVPELSVNAYKADQYWGEFNIQGAPDLPTGVDDATVRPALVVDGSEILFPQEQQVSIYTTTGVCVYTGVTDHVSVPQTGIYVVVTPSASHKIVIH